jgi:hypothetical protein
MDPWQIVAVLAGALGSTWAALAAAVLTGRLVPGHTYSREISRGDKATTQAERNADSVKTLTATIREERESRRADIEAAVMAGVKAALGRRASG